MATSERGKIQALIADLLWQFDDAVGSGVDPNWESYLSQCPDEASRASLCADMIRTESQHHGWNVHEVKSRLREYVDRGSMTAVAAGALRGIYSDRIALGETPSLVDFDNLGFDFDVLKLQATEEFAYLGQNIGGRFRIEQRLGLGNYGVVYRGHDLTANQIVALKTIRRGSVRTENTARRLLETEAALLAKLPVAGIPRFIDFISDCDGTSVLVQELIVGPTLQSLSQDGTFAPERAAQIVASLADTLQFVHRHGFVYRDLSASNIIIDESRGPILIDFGLAVSRADLFERHGERAGTPGKMPFESITGDTRQLDGRADIWALGAILYELMTGRSGLRSNEFDDKFWSAAALEAELRQPSDLPPALLTICRKCVVENPNFRYDTAGLLSRDLRTFLGKTPPVSDKVEQAGRHLFAWRIGKLLGLARSHHHYATYYWQNKCIDPDGGPPDPELRVRTALCYEVAMLDRLHDCASLAAENGSQLLISDAGVDCRDMFTREAPLIPEAYAWFPDILKNVEHELAAVDGQLRTSVCADGQIAAALFDLAVLVAYRDTSDAAIDAMKEFARIGDLEIERFSQFVSGIRREDPSEPNSKEVDRLYKSVEEELTNRLTDTLG